MGKIAKYLAQAWPATLIVFLLLVVQAFCDLRLPQYTSDIVDVGIGQGGIEYAAPEKLREETYEDLSLFMTAEERNTVAGAYRQEEDGYPYHVNQSVFTGNRQAHECGHQRFGNSVLRLSFT